MFSPIWEPEIVFTIQSGLATDDPPKVAPLPIFFPSSQKKIQLSRKTVTYLLLGLNKW
jgi:hypothetical protein